MSPALLAALALWACDPAKDAAPADTGSGTTAPTDTADTSSTKDSVDTQETGCVATGEEVPYNGVDEDCDESTPDDDLDGDGSLGADDCDDQDAARFPGNTDTWYDGVDSDCGGNDDYDQDGDGDRPIEHGGTDCDDTDPARYGGVDCRPETDVVHPSASDLTDYCQTSVPYYTDFAFDSEGRAMVCTIISGTDYVHVCQEDGTPEFTLTGYSNWNMGAVAQDPSDGAVIVGFIAGNLGFALSTDDGGTVSFEPFSTATGSTGSSYGGYMATSPSSLVVDSSGCIWAPGNAGAGTLSCILRDGSRTDYTPGTGIIEAVDLSADETLHYSEGDSIYRFDPSTGAGTLVYAAPETILDFVIDYNDDLFFETTGDEVWWVPASGAKAGALATVEGDGKLAISPDGWLVRLRTAPEGGGTYYFEEWEL